MTTKKHEEELRQQAEEEAAAKKREAAAKRQHEANAIDADLAKQAEVKRQPTDDPMATPTYDVHGPNPPSTPEKK